MQLVGFGSLTGSTINPAQDLDISTLPSDAPPEVTITAPANGATVAGVVIVTADATDDLGIAEVEFLVEGSSIGVDTDGSDGWSAPWDTSLGPDGSQEVTAIATDTSAQAGSDSITVTVDNGLASLVAMVVGSPAGLTVGDAAVRDQLEALGYTVTILDDNGATAGDSAGTAFVLVTSSANSGAVGDTFHGVDEPVWMAKPWALDDMGMTGPVGGTDYGSVSARVATIVDPTHALAAGLSGDVTMTTGSARMSWGIPGAEADVIATVGGLPTTFVYQAGDTLADGATAAGCRVTFSLFQSAPSIWTPDGSLLFETTVAYVANGCSG